MDIVKCSKCDKFFDRLTYENCPTCGAKAGKSVTEKPKKSLFSIKRPETKEIKSGNNQNMKNVSAPSVLYPGSNMSEQPLEQSVNESTDNRKDSHIGDTIGIWEQNSSVIEKPEQNQSTMQIAKESNSLSKAFDDVTASSMGKTVSYFDATMEQFAGIQNNENKAVAPKAAASREIAQTGPVSGWLVCVKGKHFGHSFSLQMGKNTIGRDESNIVSLYLDDSVSREAPATVVYEPRKREFHLMLRYDSSSMVYLNDELVTNNVILRDRDIIGIGNTDLMLVALCGEYFAWENLIGQGLDR